VHQQQQQQQQQQFLRAAAAVAVLEDLVKEPTQRKATESNGTPMGPLLPPDSASAAAAAVWEVLVKEPTQRGPAEGVDNMGLMLHQTLQQQQ
jgi:hypothetical protein